MWRKKLNCNRFTNSHYSSFISRLHFFFLTDDGRQTSVKPFILRLLSFFLLTFFLSSFAFSSSIYSSSPGFPSILLLHFFFFFFFFDLHISLFFRINFFFPSLNFNLFFHNIFLFLPSLFFSSHASSYSFTSSSSSLSFNYIFSCIFFLCFFNSLSSISFSPYHFFFFLTFTSTSSWLVSCTQTWMSTPLHWNRCSHCWDTAKFVLDGFYRCSRKNTKRPPNASLSESAEPQRD